MSRCLPFPPPHYVKNGVGGEALLEKLQLQMQKIEAKKKGKEGRRKKKGKKDIDNGGDRRHKDDKSKNDVGGKDRKRGRKHEKIVWPEKSTLSVEHEQPIIPVNVYGKEEKKFTNSPSQVLSIKAPHESKREMLEKEYLEYRKLIVNWVPPPLLMVLTDFEDEEWWLSRKKSLLRRETTQTEVHVSNGIFYQGIQPLAQYLPDANIYALPYSLQF